MGGGFEPPKASPTDLQSVPFDRSGTPPKMINNNGARDRNRTRDILITSEVLYQLSYSGPYNIKTCTTNRQKVFIIINYSAL